MAPGKARVIWAGLAGAAIIFSLFLTTAAQMALAAKITVALDAEPTNLDPRFALDANSSRVGDLIYSQLFRDGQGGELEAELVESYEIKSPLEYRFRIKKGITFHNGAELKASDVAYTYNSIITGTSKSPKKGAYSYLQSVEATDAHQVVFKLKEPYSPLLFNLQLGIVPESSAASGIAKPGSGPIASEIKPPPGSGPFKLSKWVKGEQIEIVANGSYFGGKPKLEGIIFKIVPDQTISLLELKKGSVDLIQNEIPPDYLQTLKSDRRLKVIIAPGTNYSYIGLNLQDKILSVKKVRHALAHAIDRESIIKHILKALARPAAGPLSSLNWAFEPDVRTYRYDPKRARELLDEAGFPEKTPGRERFKLNYKTSQNELRKRIAVVLQEQLDSVGVKTDLRSYEWGTFFADIRSGNFQLYALTWVGIQDPDFFYYAFHSASFDEAGANRGRYSNARVDELIMKGRLEFDRSRRKAIYGEIQKTLAEDLPYINLWHSDNVALMRKEVQGFALHPAGSLFSLKDTWVETGKK